MIRQWTRNLTTGLKGATIEGPEEPDARQKEAIERKRGEPNYKGSFCTFNLLRNRVRDMIQARRESVVQERPIQSAEKKRHRLFLQFGNYASWWETEERIYD